MWKVPLFIFMSPVTGSFTHRWVKRYFIGEWWLTHNCGFPSMPTSACHCTGLWALTWICFCIQFYGLLMFYFIGWQNGWCHEIHQCLNLRKDITKRYWLLFDYIVFLLFVCYTSVCITSIFCMGVHHSICMHAPIWQPSLYQKLTSL